MYEALNKKRIYIVEDNAHNRVIYQLILRRIGAEIHFDTRGDLTLFQLVRFMPDLIILDLNLGRYSNGFEIYEVIKKHPELHSIPVVAISASEPALMLPKCRDLGFNGFIVKPIEEDLFPGQLVQLLQGKPVWYVGERFGGEDGSDEPLRDA